MTSKVNSVRVGSLPGIRRLPFYLNILRTFHKQGREIVSAIALAEAAGQPVPLVKKDIEMTGATGKTGVGYTVAALIDDIENFLGWNNPYDAILVGVGNLGSAILGYSGFKKHGLNFVAAFDIEPDRIGRRTHAVEVLPLEKLASMVGRLHIKTAVLTVPAAAAQEVADLVVAAGITRIWNFAPVMLTVPENVLVQREDLSAGLAELLVRCKVIEAT
ncbi:MAG: redox-sensing transcriptional repressor Rex [Planctomycetes bacterium]|nr:redox-sensing transcriptional repressor Rex [Planctomycetota bacterium]